MENDTTTNTVMGNELYAGIPIDLDFFQKKSDPISTDTLRLFHIVMTGVWIIVSISGVITNSLNLQAFLRIGLEDSVTVSFFSLTISDLSICSIALIEMFAFLCIVLETELKLWFYLPPTLPTYYLMCVRRIFNVTTVLITTFLAIQRCVCVVLPFKVKEIFTRSRTIYFVLVIFSFSVICYSLYIWRHTVVLIWKADFNASQLSLSVVSGSESVLNLIEVVLGIGLNVSCQIIVFLCFVVMFIGLKKAAQFRKSSIFVRPDNDNKDSGAKATTALERTASRENQALVQVALLSAIFMVTNSPYLFYGIASIVMPEFGLYQAFHNLYHFTHNVMFTLELVSSAINFFVYYNYNSKFRKSCFAFRRRQE